MSAASDDVLAAISSIATKAMLRQPINERLPWVLIRRLADREHGAQQTADQWLDAARARYGDKS